MATRTVVIWETHNYKRFSQNLTSPPARSGWRDRARAHALDSTPMAGIEPSLGPGAMVQTANGIVVVRRGTAESITIGPIERQNVAVHISDAFGDMNVIGMNFLSTLTGWSVEGRTLVLRTGTAEAAAEAKPPI